MSSKVDVKLMESVIWEIIYKPALIPNREATDADSPKTGSTRIRALLATRNPPHCSPYAPVFISTETLLMAQYKYKMYHVRKSNIALRNKCIIRLSIVLIL